MRAHSVLSILLLFILSSCTSLGQYETTVIDNTAQVMESPSITSNQNERIIDNNWTIKNYNAINGNTDWRGVDVYYRGEKVYHFASCFGWGTPNQSDIYDFCGANIDVISSGDYGLELNLVYNYPGSPLEPGKYIIKPNGSIINSDSITNQEKYQWKKMTKSLGFMNAESVYTYLPSESLCDTYIDMGTCSYSGIWINTPEEIKIRNEQIELKICSDQIQSGEISPDSCYQESDIKRIKSWWKSLEQDSFTGELDYMSRVGGFKKLGAGRYISIKHSPQYDADLNVLFTYTEYLGSGRAIVYTADISRYYSGDTLKPNDDPSTYYSRINKEFLDGKFSDKRIQKHYDDVINTIADIHNITSMTNSNNG